jgi:RNA polymerase sigma-70 factor (ECF subfamily)
VKGGEAAVETVKGPDSKEERIERMVALYQLPLLRLCILYLHDEELAKDAVQETFIKAYRNLDGFRAEASEKTWLTRIAVNTCKNVYRSGWFRHVDRSVTLDMIAEKFASPNEEDNALTEAIMRLPRKLREAALLCWLQGMTYEEAADALGISRQAVGSRLNRARRKLRFALEGSEEHDPA